MIYLKQTMPVGYIVLTSAILQIIIMTSDIKEQQRTVVLGTVQILQTVKIKYTLEQATKAQKLYSSFNVGARWRCVINAKPRLLYPREGPGTHCLRGWVGPRAGLDGCGKSLSHRDSIPGPSNP
jgi:hypothetical protein